ncbi:MAG: CHRD domain-containing protein [Planctomycetes bacterium]|nr:CHRD domain-containing protein [Planctomycetota bacterium]
MPKLRHSPCLVIGFAVLCGGAGLLFGQQGPPKLFKKFSGRVPVFSLNGDNKPFPNPADLDPTEDCTNGVDDDGDGTIDYNDSDCQAGLGPEALHLKLPFDVVQPIGTFAPARYTGSTNRDADALGFLELLINSTGPGGRKLSYLRTADPNSYADVIVKAQILPGGSGDQGGPVAIRIQPADATAHAGKSYFVKVVPGPRISIAKDLGDGNEAELAGTEKWASGDNISIPDFSPGAGPYTSYWVEFSAIGSALKATVSEVDGLSFFMNKYDPINNHTVTLNATDSDLKGGYVGLRSDNDLGGAEVDDLVSADSGDPSVQSYEIIDPNADVNPDAPSIAFFGGFSSRMDQSLDHNTDKITSNDSHPWNRSLSLISDVALASYLRSLGFQVDEYFTGSFGVADTVPIDEMTPEGISAKYDLLWVTSSGGGSETRPFTKRVTISFVFAEHVAGQEQSDGMKLYSNNSGNEGRTGCDASRRFAATLTGAKERPESVDTVATGFGNFTYNPDTRDLAFNIQFSGLSSPETAAHIHKGGPEEAGPPIHALPAGNPKGGTVNLSEAEALDLAAGNAYVNIHSTNHPGGEIRGQLSPANLGVTSIRVIAADQGGDPGHPIIKGLADAKSNIPVYDVNEIPLNLPYPHPGTELAGVGGKGFKTVKEILDERNSGPGATETQYGGYPVAPGAKILGAMVNPCTEEPFFQLNEDGTLGGDGKGHLALVAAEKDSARLGVDPSDCPSPDNLICFPARTVFYWVSDRQFPYSTLQALAILRRSALWSLGYLDSPNRSDVPFLRGDSNNDGTVDISDAIHSLTYKFVGGEEPACLDAADSNDDEQVDQSDAIVTLSYLFLGDARPASPFQISFQGCGLDFTPRPTADEKQNPELILSCKSYSHCRN